MLLGGVGLELGNRSDLESTKTISFIDDFEILSSAVYQALQQLRLVDDGVARGGVQVEVYF